MASLLLNFIPKRLASRIYAAHGETCYVAYHPDSDPPYSTTRPLPQPVVDKESLLKVNSKHMITQSPNLEQLQALTYTHARFWHNYKGREKRNKYREAFNDNVYRPGLSS